ncbi:hypothetical protein SALCHL_006550 [Streptomyces albus subsp. chlorinus]|uniref:hypothetical protein n=1 Tax=Streptomyces albus TaxID=1888 RepID=UPI0015702FE2|nr:hypothetical protein [Streptomyces albus]
MFGSSVVCSAISVLPVPHMEIVWPREPDFFQPGHCAVERRLLIGAQHSARNGSQGRGL